MKSILTKAARFLAEDDGPTAVEYAVVLLLIFLACLAAIGMMGESTANSFESSQNSVEQAFRSGS